jgi:2-polyprenyl-3-methyl-5-hydroxy-6-metoxy-1,4-benzoquinol methylase
MNLDYAKSRETRPDFRYRLRRRTREVLEAIRTFHPSPKRLADLGTAEGKMLQEIQRHFPESWCLGIDHSLPLLLYGKNSGLGSPVVCGDVQDLAFLKSGVFEVIVAAAVIEHLPSPTAFLQECFRLLPKGGILVLTTPHPFWEKMSGALGWIRGEHHSVMTPRRLADLCEAEHFIIRREYGFMLSPVGLPGEKTIERILALVSLDRYLPNHLLVAQK